MMPQNSRAKFFDLLENSFESMLSRKLLMICTHCNEKKQKNKKKSNTKKNGWLTTVKKFLETKKEGKKVV